ncbi:MAG: hypothetical protein K1X92_07405 [Bacteroidia bacterium]|nr:hypothetical protein [Bacteroidia bacterium]
MQNTLVLKSNINCNNCVQKVTPFLNKESKIQEWVVDTQNPDKLITIKGEDLTFELIEKTLRPSGFKVEKQ